MNALAVSEHEASLPRLPLEPDVFGRMVMDHFQGMVGEYYLRRDDNFVERDNSARYFRSWEQMPAHQRCLLNHARGRVLDIGAGAGQHALVLQERGMEVVAVDSSPLAVEVCRARGVREAQVMDARALQFAPESFDTVLLMGNCLGVAGSPTELRRLLWRLHRIVRPGGQILADITDYTMTREAIHLRYQRWNESRGRYPGAIRLRLEYQGKRGPEFDWLLMKLPDLRGVLAETGWRIIRCVQVNAEATFAIGMGRD